MDSTSYQANHLVLDDFLALRLHNVVREVLAHMFVGRSGEADDGLAASVAHINTN